MAVEVLFPNKVDFNNETHPTHMNNPPVNPDIKPSTLKTWQKFVDFLLRHLSQVSMKYEDWENEEYEFFCQGLDYAESIDGAALSLSDLKKRAKLLSEHRVKNDAANRDKYGELIHIENRTVSPDPEPILNYLDLLATLKGLSNVAGDFQKSLKKQNMPNIEDQAQVQKYWKAMALPRVDLSNIQPKDQDAGLRGIWTGLSRTLLNLSFQFLRKASWNSGIKLKADAELVAFNLTEPEIEWAKKIVTEIERQLQKEYGNGQDIKQQEEDELSKLLSNLGSKNAEESESKKIIGMDQDGTLILPEEPPKQKPLSKKKKTKKSSRATSAMVKGHHRKTKNK